MCHPVDHTTARPQWKELTDLRDDVLERQRDDGNTHATTHTHTHIHTQTQFKTVNSKQILCLRAVVRAADGHVGV